MTGGGKNRTAVADRVESANSKSSSRTTVLINFCTLISRCPHPYFPFVEIEPRFGRTIVVPDDAPARDSSSVRPRCPLYSQRAVVVGSQLADGPETRQMLRKTPAAMTRAFSSILLATIGGFREKSGRAEAALCCGIARNFRRGRWNFCVRNALQTR